MIVKTGPCAECGILGRPKCRFCDPQSPDYIRRPELSTPEGRSAYVYGRIGLEAPPPHRREDCRYRRCCVTDGGAS